MVLSCGLESGRRLACTTDLKANQSGMSSPARRALRNLVPDRFSLCRPSRSATSAVT